jgi:hypothetical protein
MASGAISVFDAALASGRPGGLHLSETISKLAMFPAFPTLLRRREKIRGTRERFRRGLRSSV